MQKAQRDNIKVAVRVRPFAAREKDDPCVVFMDGDETSIKSKSFDKTFIFDHSVWSAGPRGGSGSAGPGGGRENQREVVDQAALYALIGRDIFKNALKGYNGCLFAYGQTGSGKTHSLIGRKDDPGVLPRFFDDLAAFRLEAEERRNIAVPKGSSRSVSFEKGLSSEAEGGGAGEGVGAAGEEDSQTTGQEGEGSQQLEGEPEEDGAAVQEVRVTLSFLELYNERIHDLLSLSSGTSPGSAAPSPGPTTSSAIDRESGLAFFAPQVERFSPGTVSSAPLSPGDAARRASRAQTSEGGGLGGLGASGLSASRAQLAEGPLEIFQHPQHGVFIPNLSQAVVKSRHDMQKLLIYAMQKRSMGATNMNRESSRSHMVCIITISQIFDSGRPPLKSQVNFVDLAGSERHEKAHAERDGLWHGGGSPAPPLAHLHGGASRIGTGTGQEMWQQRTASLTGDGRHQRQREGAFINTSLSVLGVVISRLAEGQMKGDKTPSAGQAGGSGAPGTLARSFKRSATAGVAQKSTAKTLNRSGTRVGGPGDALGGKSLQQRQDHIPFRSSKLTFLLKDSLSGNSKTSMLATISPAESQLSETVSTLRFAQSVKSIRTNARVNVDRTGDLVKTLKGELQQLKSQLNKLSITSTASAFESARVRGLLSEVEEKERLSRELAKQWEDKVKESEDMQEKRKKAIESMGLATGDVTSLLQIGEDTPYLLNISDDPMLTGCVMYFLRRDEETLVGKAEEANVRLPGSGIEDTHCILENSEDSELKVRLASPSARVLVNGSRLDDERPLRHHDRLVIGRTFAFRVVVPKTVRSAAAVAAAAGRGKGFDIPTPRGLMDVSVRSGRDRSASSRSRLDSDVVAETSSETGGENGDKPARASNGSSAGGVGGVSLGAFPAGMDETEAMWIENEAALREFEDEDVRRFFQELQDRLGPLRTQTFLLGVKQTLSSVDTANDMLEELWPAESLMVTLETLSEPRSYTLEAPEEIIRVSRRRTLGADPGMPSSSSSSSSASPGPSPSPSTRLHAADGTSVALWPVRKFRRRLETLTRLHKKFQRLKADALEDARATAEAEKGADKHLLSEGTVGGDEEEKQLGAEAAAIARERMNAGPAGSSSSSAEHTSDGSSATFDADALLHLWLDPEGEEQDLQVVQAAVRAQVWEEISKLLEPLKSAVSQSSSSATAAPSHPSQKPGGSLQMSGSIGGTQPFVSPRGHASPGPGRERRLSGTQVPLSARNAPTAGPDTPNPNRPRVPRLQLGGPSSSRGPTPLPALQKAATSHTHGKWMSPSIHPFPSPEGGLLSSSGGGKAGGGGPSLVFSRTLMRKALKSNQKSVEDGRQGLKNLVERAVTALKDTHGPQLPRASPRGSITSGQQGAPPSASGTPAAAAGAVGRPTLMSQTSAALPARLSLEGMVGGPDEEQTRGILPSSQSQPHHPSQPSSAAPTPAARASSSTAFALGASVRKTNEKEKEKEKPANTENTQHLASIAESLAVLREAVAEVQEQQKQLMDADTKKLSPRTAAQLLSIKMPSQQTATGGGGLVPPEGLSVTPSNQRNPGVGETKQSRGTETGTHRSLLSPIASEREHLSFGGVTASPAFSHGAASAPIIGPTRTPASQRAPQDREGDGAATGIIKGGSERPPKLMQPDSEEDLSSFCSPIASPFHQLHRSPVPPLNQHAERLHERTPHGGTNVGKTAQSPSPASDASSEQLLTHRTEIHLLPVSDSPPPLLPRPGPGGASGSAGAQRTPARVSWQEYPLNRFSDGDGDRDTVGESEDAESPVEGSPDAWAGAPLWARRVLLPLVQQLSGGGGTGGSTELQKLQHTTLSVIGRNTEVLRAVAKYAAGGGASPRRSRDRWTISSNFMNYQRPQSQSVQPVVQQHMRTPCSAHGPRPHPSYSVPPNFLMSFQQPLTHTSRPRPHPAPPPFGQPIPLAQFALPYRPSHIPAPHPAAPSPPPQTVPEPAPLARVPSDTGSSRGLVSCLKRKQDRERDRLSSAQSVIRRDLDEDGMISDSRSPRRDVGHNNPPQQQQTSPRSPALSEKETLSVASLSSPEGANSSTRRRASVTFNLPSKGTEPPNATEAVRETDDPPTLDAPKGLPLSHSDPPDSADIPQPSITPDGPTRAAPAPVATHQSPPLSTHWVCHYHSPPSQLPIPQAPPLYDPFGPLVSHSTGSLGALTQQTSSQVAILQGETPNGPNTTRASTDSQSYLPPAIRPPVWNLGAHPLPHPTMPPTTGDPQNPPPPHFSLVRQWTDESRPLPPMPLQHPSVSCPGPAMTPTPDTSRPPSSSQQPHPTPGGKPVVRTLGLPVTKRVRHPHPPVSFRPLPMWRMHSRPIGQPAGAPQPVPRPGPSDFHGQIQPRNAQGIAWREPVPPAEAACHSVSESSSAGRSWPEMQGEQPLQESGGSYDWCAGCG